MSIEEINNAFVETNYFFVQEKTREFYESLSLSEKTVIAKGDGHFLLPHLPRLYFDILSALSENMIREQVALSASVQRGRQSVVTNLMDAFRIGNLEGAKVLIELGSDVNAQDAIYRSPLHYAIEAGIGYEALRLLSHPYHPSHPPSLEKTFNINTIYTQPVLICAVRLGQEECVKKLIELGADIEVADHLSARTALGHAVFPNRQCRFSMNIVRLLINAGANIAAVQPDTIGGSRVSSLAAMVRNVVYASHTSSPANPNKPEEEVELIELFLKSGIRVDEDPSTALSPIPLAMSMMRYDITSLLVKWCAPMPRSLKHDIVLNGMNFFFAIGCDLRFDASDARCIQLAKDMTKILTLVFTIPESERTEKNTRDTEASISNFTSISGMWTSMIRNLAKAVSDPLFGFNKNAMRLVLIPLHLLSLVFPGYRPAIRIFPYESMRSESRHGNTVGLDEQDQAIIYAIDILIDYMDRNPLPTLFDILDFHRKLTKCSPFSFSTNPSQK